ncbi:MAG: rec2 [Moraxellaceae bacterium]|jgi:competence protein ComEC|nr:rec2 [Moraxellaceae bacterium]
MGFLLAAAAAGFLILPLLPVLPPLWALLVPAGVLALAAGWRRNSILLAGSLFFLAAAWSVSAARQALELRIPQAWEERVLLAQGTVQGLPEPSGIGGMRFRFLPATLQMEEGAAALVTDGTWQLFSARPVALEPGARCGIAVRLKRPHGVANAGGFDYEAWLLSEGITATGTVRSLTCEKPAGFAIDRLRQRLRDTFIRSFPDNGVAGVLLALVSGDRVLVPDAAWERYSDTGIVHLMAISGLHVTLLGALAGWCALRLLRFFPGLALRVPLHKSALLAGLAVAVAYSLVAGFSLPTRRTLVMLAVVAVLCCRERRLPPFQILLLALIAVLLWSPLAVHAAGFWLSFGAVALLMLLGRALRDLPPWRQALQAQLLISLLLLPLTVWFFGQASWVSPFANLLAVPVVTFLVVPAGLAGLLLWCGGMEGVAVLAWKGGIWLITVLDALLEQFAAWPGASVPWSLPGPFGFLCLTLALACLLQPLQWRLKLLAPAFLLPLLLPAPQLQPGQMRVTLLDVGQGLAVLVETQHHRLLYDTGPTLGPHADAGRRIILPALQRQGVRRLDRLVLSHDDRDHTGGAASLLAALPVGDGLGARPQGSEGMPWRECRAGQRWQWDGWDFAVLFPNEQQAQFARKDNNRSCVLRIRRGHSTVILPGDIDRVAELALVSAFSPRELQADVLVLAHHGSRSSSSAEFLAAVRPRWALVSAGYRNAFHHPSDKVLARLDEARIPWRNTAASGAVTLWLDERGVVRTEEFRRTAARYWYN